MQRDIPGLSWELFPFSRNRKNIVEFSFRMFFTLRNDGQHLEKIMLVLKITDRIQSSES